MRTVVSRLALGCAVVLLSGIAPVALAADPPPCESGTFIVPYPPGGPTDMLSRLVAKGLTGTWAKNMVVLNRPGAGSAIGTNDVAKAAGDGCTMGVVALPFVTNPIVTPQMPFDSARDIKPVGVMVTFAGVLVVHPDHPATTLAELIDHARKNPRKVTYATTGGMGFSHLTTELIADRAGIELTHVPYKGSSAAYPDLITGRVSMMIDSGPPVVALVKSGKVRALAVTSAERNPMLPDVPTVAESGFDVKVDVWLGLVAPGKTPDAKVEALSREVSKLLREEALVNQFRELSFRPQGGTPAEFRATLASDRTRWETLVKKRGIKPD